MGRVLSEVRRGSDCSETITGVTFKPCLAVAIRPDFESAFRPMFRPVWERPRRLPGASRDWPEGPKPLQDRPKKLQDRPRRPQELPKEPQERPKRPQDGFKTTPRAHKRPPKSHQEALKPIWDKKRHRREFETRKLKSVGS